MSIMEIQKKFHEVKTGRFFDTLAAAKRPANIRISSASGCGTARRSGGAPFYAYGESCGTVKVADEEIAEMLTDKQ